MSKKITKKEIRTQISEIKTLSKAHRIVIADKDISEPLIIKMAEKTESLIRRIIEERNLPDWEIEDLQKSVKEINNHIKEEDYEKELFFDEEYTCHANINIAMTKIGVYCDL